VAWPHCSGWIGAEPNILCWHHWPDDRIHEYSEPGDGLQKLTREAAQQLTSDSFWKMVEHFAQGRRLAITSDHGYAASGMFADVGDREQSAWLKASLGSSRFAPGKLDEQHWSPPIALSLESQHGVNHFALGRRKWRSAGGYPTLSHGGLSLLEVAVPYIELSKQ
jgi:hypothetical protein